MGESTGETRPWWTRPLRGVEPTSVVFLGAMVLLLGLPVVASATHRALERQACERAQDRVAERIAEPMRQATRGLRTFHLQAGGCVEWGAPARFQVTSPSWHRHRDLRRHLTALGWSRPDRTGPFIGPDGVTGNTFASNERGEGTWDIWLILDVPEISRGFQIQD